MNTLTQDKIPLKCEICDKEVKSSKGLKRHFNIIHDLEREHQCNICQRIFNVQSQLTSHTHWGNSLLYRNRKVEIEAAICLRFFHGKNKNMATSLMSGKNWKKFVVIFQKVQKNPSFD